MPMCRCVRGCVWVGGDRMKPCDVYLVGLQWEVASIHLALQVNGTTALLLRSVPVALILLR